ARARAGDLFRRETRMVDRVALIAIEIERDGGDRRDRAGKTKHRRRAAITERARGMLEVRIRVRGDRGELVGFRWVVADVALGETNRADVERDEAFGVGRSFDELRRASADVDDEIRAGRRH